MALAKMDMDAMEQEGDGDVEGLLLQQFSSMGTTDKEVLISEFQRLLGNQLNSATCAFFLDMNNCHQDVTVIVKNAIPILHGSVGTGNLQAGICSYLDLEQPNQYRCYIRDMSHETGSVPSSNTHVTKTFYVKNTGTERWPPGCSLRYCEGAHLTPMDRVLVDALNPQDSTNVALELTCPSTAGVHEASWQMCSPTGHLFGECVRVHVNVVDSDIIGVTEQMSSLSPSNHHHTQTHFSNLPTTVCVDATPVTSMSSMRMIGGDTVFSSSHTPKSSAHISQNDFITPLLLPSQTSTTPDSEDVDMIT